MARETYQDYNRLYDLELTFNRDTPLNKFTEKLYGVRKISQVFLNIYLKELDKRLKGSFATIQIVRTIVRESIESTLNIMKSEYNHKDISDEIIDSVVIESLYLETSVIVLVLRLKTLAGNEAPIGIGYKITF